MAQSNSSISILNSSNNTTTSPLPALVPTPPIEAAELLVHAFRVLVEREDVLERRVQQLEQEISYLKMIERGHTQ